MKLDEIETGLKEVAEILRQVKHYVTKNNVPLPDGMKPVLALMRHHESLQNLLEHNWKQIRCPEMVNLPTNVEQARAMATVGTQWLMDNAPSELTHPWQMYLVAKKQNDEMTSLLADINEYCQANGIGTIGDSASKALMTSHTNLQEQLKTSQQDYWRAVGKGTPLGDLTVKDASKCRAESKGECGCAFGQCANGLVF